MFIFQNDNVQIQQAQSVNKQLGGSMKIHFHTLPLSPNLKFIESLWDAMEETLQCAELHCQYKILTKN